LILFLNFLPVSLLGEVLPFQDSAQHKTYTVSSSEVKVMVEHPFRIAVLTTNQVQGSLRLNVQNLNQGASVHLNVDPKTFETPSSKIRQEAFRQLTTNKGGLDPISFESSFVDLRSLVMNEGKASHFQLYFKSDLKMKNLQKNWLLPMSCFLEVDVIKCYFQTEFYLFDYGMTPPSFLGIRGGDHASVKGSLFFVEKPL